MKAKAFAALGLVAVVALGAVIAGKHKAALDPLHREPSQAAAHGTAQPTPTEQTDFSDKRWQQRLDERRAERAMAANAPGAVNDPSGVARRGDAAPGAGSPDSTGNLPGNSAPGSLAPGAVSRDGHKANGNGTSGPVVNARLANDPTPTSPATAAAAESKSSGKGASARTPGTTPGAGGTPFRGCGDGVLEAGEQCEPASTPKCGDDCTPVISDACYDCEVNSVCVPIASACVDFSSDKFSQSLCYDVEHCIQDTGCAGGEATLTSCFCGDMTMEQCRSAPSSGDLAPHGLCADVIRDALGTGVSNAFVLTHYTTNATPAGAAIKRFQCLKSDPTCTAVCFPKSGAR